jgi:mRNA-degrading endonuclease toxin of MazEF toxin-antitoxin module
MDTKRPTTSNGTLVPHRGEMYYIHETDDRFGNGKPGIIVSDNALNEKSSYVIVVYLTDRLDTSLTPSHFKMRIGGRCVDSMVMCEKIHSIPLTRLGDFIMDLGKSDLELLNDRVSFTLGVSDYLEEKYPVKDITEQIQSSIKSIPPAPVAEPPELPDLKKDIKIVKLTAERDLYKSLYEKCLAERLGGK